jgi:hypothetical protein
MRQMRCNHCPAPVGELCRGIESGATGVKRFCELVDPSRPDYQPAYIRILVRSLPPDHPPIMVQAKNALAAIGRTVGAAVTGQAVLVPPEERDRRWAQCMTCVHLKADRCELCGCFFGVKIELAREACPDSPPRWEPYQEKEHHDQSTA